MRIGTPVAGLAGDELDVLGPTDVARVQAQAVHASLQGGQRHAVAVVHIGHDRHRRPGHDVGQPGRSVGIVAGAPHDVGAGTVEGIHLLQGALDVGGLGGGHRLHRDRRATPDGDGVRRVGQGEGPGGSPFGDRPRLVHRATSGLAMSR
jgi:hypothetical protein